MKTPKRIRVPISTARARLFELTDLVRASRDDTVVVLEQRGAAEGVALVRETQLAYLESRVRELEKRDGQPFTLAGSLTSDLDDAGLDESFRAIRSEWTPGAAASLPTPRRGPTGRRKR